MIERAKLVLAQLEAEDRISPARKLIDDLPLFAAARRAAPPAPQADAGLTALVEALAALHPDEMSPRDALEALYALKAKLAKANIAACASCADRMPRASRDEPLQTRQTTSPTDQRRPHAERRDEIMHGEKAEAEPIREAEHAPACSPWLCRRCADA